MKRGFPILWLAAALSVLPVSGHTEDAELPAFRTMPSDFTTVPGSLSLVSPLPPTRDQGQLGICFAEADAFVFDQTNCVTAEKTKEECASLPSSEMASSTSLAILAFNAGKKVTKRLFTVGGNPIATWAAYFDDGAVNRKSCTDSSFLLSEGDAVDKKRIIDDSNIDGDFAELQAIYDQYHAGGAYICTVGESDLIKNMLNFYAKLDKYDVDDADVQKVADTALDLKSFADTYEQRFTGPSGVYHRHTGEMARYLGALEDSKAIKRDCTSEQVDRMNSAISAIEKFSGYAVPKISLALALVAPDREAFIRKLFVPDACDIARNSMDLMGTWDLRYVDGSYVKKDKPDFLSKGAVGKYLDYYRKVIAHNHPITAMVCAFGDGYTKPRGDCRNFMHTIVVVGVQKACDKDGQCRDFLKLQNSWGQKWQDDHNDGWVDAVSFLERTRKNAFYLENRFAPDN